jgi:SPP1 family predicted phage head-tail adaptor
MAAGRLRHQVIIEHKVVERDPVYNSEIVSWEAYTDAWASIAGLTGREYVASAIMEVAATTSKITMRYKADIDSTMRITHAGVIYGIDAILPDERRKFMTLMCTQSSV